MSDDWKNIAKVDDIDSETFTLKVIFEGKDVCLFNIDGTVFATQDKCPHGNASLADGWVEDCKVECPLHQGVFDIATGKPLSPPVETDLDVYDVKVEGDEIFLKERSNES